MQKNAHAKALTLRVMVKEAVRVKVRDCLMTVKFRVEVTVTV